VVFFMLYGEVPIVLLATLAIALYLTWIELRSMPLSRMQKLWWYLLVLLTHFVGYLVLRLYAARRGRTA
jgi:hypothetical protein